MVHHKRNIILSVFAQISALWNEASDEFMVPLTGALLVRSIRIAILMLVSAKADGHAVGIYAINHDVERDVWTLSYVNRYDDWGKGYSVEGMKALMEHAVKEYGAHTSDGECARENTGSRRVMEKLGMVYDHSSSYTKSDGSATFESDVFTLTIG